MCQWGWQFARQFELLQGSAFESDCGQLCLLSLCIFVCPFCLFFCSGTVWLRLCSLHLCQKTPVYVKRPGCHSQFGGDFPPRHQAGIGATNFIVHVQASRFCCHHKQAELAKGTGVPRTVWTWFGKSHAPMAEHSQGQPLGKDNECQKQKALPDKDWEKKGENLVSWGHFACILREGQKWWLSWWPRLGRVSALSSRICECGVPALGNRLDWRPPQASSLEASFATMKAIGFAIVLPLWDAVGDYIAPCKRHVICSHDLECEFDLACWAALPNLFLG